MSTFKDKLKNFLLLNTLVWACVSGAQADDFTNERFLKRAEAHQKFWIQGSIDSLAVVASSSSKEAGKCIMHWYYGDKHAEHNGLIFATLEKYPDAHPGSVMLALIEQACGTLKK